MRFTKDQRLKSRHEFKKVFRSGKRLFSRYCCIQFCENSSPEARLGITVTKKFGKAHDRNTFKRHIREAFRKSPLQKGLDLNIRPILTASQIDYKQLQHDLTATLRKL